MKNRIAILGVDGFIGNELYKTLKDSYEVVGISHKSEHKENRWSLGQKPISQITNSDIVINCMRSNDFSLNVSATKRLLSQISSRQKLIILASNAISARPTNKIMSYFFKGDAYIREKKIISQLANKFKKRKQIIELTPTIVTGSGGSWSGFLNDVIGAKKVLIPVSILENKIRIISVSYLCEIIKQAITNDTLNELNDIELYSEEIKVSEFIEGANLVPYKAENNFFDSFYMNFIFGFLCSFFIPNKIVFYMQSRLKKQNQGVKNPVQVNINGMTRFYLKNKI